MILAGVTFLFGLASTNGTMEKVAAHALRACGGQPAWLPLITYLLVTFLTTIGPGTSPPRRWLLRWPWPSLRASASRLPDDAARRGAANGAAFSPFTPRASSPTA